MEALWDRYILRRKMNSLARRLNWSWAPARPVWGWLVPTSRCNLACKTCPAHAPVHGTDPNYWSDMKPEVYARFREDVLPSLRILHISGDGEPFFAPKFEEMLDDILDGRREVTIVTNGTIIRRRAIERAVKNPVTFRVSMDGSTNETNFANRGVKLDRILEFLHTVKTIAATGAHPRFLVQISYVVLRSNLHQMTEAVELAHRYGVKEMCFGNFVTDDRTDDYARRESLFGCPEEVLPYWQRAHDRGRELGVHVYPMSFDCKDRPEAEQRKHKPDLYDGERIRQCPHPWWSVYVEADGRVKPCCVYHWFMGNILEQPLWKIWNGPKWRALRRIVNTPRMPDVCRSCFIQTRI
ncbi:MAG: radical SAM protein [Candidatus Sumerlaeia bacterium]|nr:radical SAM protein [Candidatus Sumerlaeia bacterium]